MSSSVENQQTQQTQPPPLTPAMIQRVKEGLSAARDRRVRYAVENARNNLDAIAKGESDQRVRGGVRRFILRSFIHLMFSVRIENPEHIPTQPALLTANHLNHIDPLLILAEVPGHPYYYTPADSRTLYNHWWKRWILGWAGGVIPLERRWKEEKAVIEAAQAGREDLADLAAAIEEDVPSNAGLGNMRQMERVIQAIFARGDGVLIFPEGRLGEVEGELQLPLARGGIMYALRAGVPIVPVALIGTHDLYFRKLLTLRFGEPLHFPQSQRPKPKEVQKAMEILQEALIKLLPNNYQEPNQPKPLRHWLNCLLL